MRRTLVFALAALPTAAMADLSLTIPAEGPSERTSIPYNCEGVEAFSVEYVNAGSNSLALVPVENEVLVFANVLSGSGARYAAGPYVWWTSGRSAELYDLRRGESAGAIASCSETGN